MTVCVIYLFLVVPWFGMWFVIEKFSGHTHFLLCFSIKCLAIIKQLYIVKVSKDAKIRNRYNQVPHMTQDTNEKVTYSQLDTSNESQGVSFLFYKNSKNMNTSLTVLILDTICLHISLLVTQDFINIDNKMKPAQLLI